MSTLRADPRRVATAEVHKAGRLAAHLTRTDHGVELRYTPAYLDDPGPGIATTLPVTESPVLTAGGAVPPFFAGLLPEGRRLTSLRRAVKTSADDDLSLLIAVGADPVGDVQVLLPGAEPAAADVPTVESSWGEIDFAEVLSAGGIDPAALAGVQDKVSGRMLTVPMIRGGRLHLLKLNPPEYPSVVENESYFLFVARRLRQGAVHAEVVRDRSGASGLLVERFDRTPLDTGVGRIAVEDAAQLLGRYPADKYSVSTETVLARVGTVCQARLPAVRAVLQQVALAWLTGNGDLHAKNLSVLRTPEGGWRPTPIYDIPSTLPYGDHRMALTVAGRDDSLSRKRYLALADGAGLTAAAADRALSEVLRATADVDERIGDTVPMDPRTLRDVRRVLRRRRAGLGG